MTITSAARAIHVLRGLLAAGVREVVLSPGSRSAPLALALHAADAAGDVRLHVRLDERSAGFLALGLTVGSRSPVAVVMTSGTAVGNLLPAVMEAHHAGRPLIVVSADRPASLRGTGANQTTWQDGIFGVFAPTVDVAVDASHDAVSQAVSEAGRRLGPSHLNVQFDAPLLPDPGMPWWPGPLDASDPLDLDVDSSSARASGGSLEEVPLGAAAVTLAAGPRTVVLAGDDAGSAARVLAESAGVPLLAEPTSGSRAGDHAIRTYRLLLGTALGAAIERVIVIGHPTLSRPVTALLSRPDIALYAVRTRTGVATDPARRAIILDVPPALDARRPASAGTDPGTGPGRRREVADCVAGRRCRVGRTGRRPRRRPARPARPARGGRGVRGPVAGSEPRRRLVQPDPRPGPHAPSLIGHASTGSSSPTGAWPASTALSRPPSGSRWAGPAAFPRRVEVFRHRLRMAEYLDRAGAWPSWAT
jgi:2-succinyl-5-enolpyruvyl-6-hydroxy-3-cyclohexene-1-carboxylate synthase